MTSPDTTTLPASLQTLIQELSASGSTTLSASTNTVPAPNLTLREAVQAILWITNAGVDMTGTAGPSERPFSPNIPDTLLGHVLSMRAEGLITQAILTDLAARLGSDVATIRSQVIASFNVTAPSS